ncbi:hypothetical protein GGP45_003182 [Salinibacter ruber]|uniref:Uncharacterized protein n=1 Tax=Salinibacter ruber TaxID=146919 RepID=A0A9X2ZU27_9BACT|nr:hypothetical protein [Salinibacter ruber]
MMSTDGNLGWGVKRGVLVFIDGTQGGELVPQPDFSKSIFLGAFLPAGVSFTPVVVNGGLEQPLSQVRTGQPVILDMIPQTGENRLRLRHDVLRVLLESEERICFGKGMVIHPSAICPLVLVTGSMSKGCC